MPRTGVLRTVVADGEDRLRRADERRFREERWRFRERVAERHQPELARSNLPKRLLIRARIWVEANSTARSYLRSP